jgi:hypothetical protein
MTERQIRWAASHDWFIAITADGEGVLVLDAYTTRDGRYVEDSRCFSDYYKLRNWAGY